MGYTIITGNGHLLAKVAALHGGNALANTSFLHLPDTYIGKRLLFVVLSDVGPNITFRQQIFSDGELLEVVGIPMRWQCRNAPTSYTSRQEFIARGNYLYKLECPWVSKVSFTVMLAEYIDPDFRPIYKAPFRIIKKVNVGAPTIEQILETAIR